MIISAFVPLTCDDRCLWMIWPVAKNGKIIIYKYAFCKELYLWIVPKALNQSGWNYSHSTVRKLKSVPKWFQLGANFLPRLLELVYVEINTHFAVDFLQELRQWTTARKRSCSARSIIIRRLPSATARPRPDRHCIPCFSCYTRI